MKAICSVCASAAAVSLALSIAGAADDIDIPASPPRDGVMASAEEIRSSDDWAGAVFAGAPPRGVPSGIAIQVRRQDHGAFHFRRSCIGTAPLRIGSQPFQHGLGTHGNSEILVHVPAGAERFLACAGIDNNDDTLGERGSVVFSAEAGGKEILRTGVCRGGDAPIAVSVAIPSGATQLVLKADTTPDGPGWDQADWADARFAMADGSERWLDEGHEDTLLTGTTAPFSFVFGGVDSASLLPKWARTSAIREDTETTRRMVRWADPETGLAVSAQVRTFKHWPAIDWVLSFENTGTNVTPILENIQALDLQIGDGHARQPVIVHRLEGDACGERSFTPVRTALVPGQELRMAPTGGRPSSISAFPFFNVQDSDRGVIVAIGWSGQWAARIVRGPDGATRLIAGMEQTRLVLHPGEKIRTPRIVLMPWQGDRTTAHNRWRRLLLFQYVPRQDGRPVHLPVALQCFDRYSRTRPEWATEAGQIAAATAAADLGFDHHWFDAAWFPGDFPNGVGNWFCKPEAFPNGLKPVSDACHARGLKFVLWFEPERVAKGTRIAEEHPEFVFGGKEGGLFKLNDPAARRFLTDLLSTRIREYGVDVYRNDFNIDPLAYWRANDAPDRQGMTEIRYVEGHYAMWDELLARHPGLAIDNCASGGRRIDIETISRSVPLWRSDTSCWPGHADWNQVQTAGLSPYIPFHAACAWTPEPYDVRSAGTAGLLAQFDYLAQGFSMEAARSIVAEAKANRAYWYGDFYPLSIASSDPEGFVAYQFHRPDLDAGLILAFRHAACVPVGLVVAPQGIDPGADYAVEFVGDDGVARREAIAGKRLSEGLELRPSGQGSSLAVRYRKTP